jgi:hypothetical protein
VGRTGTAKTGARELIRPSRGWSNSVGLHRKIQLVLAPLADVSELFMTHPRIADLYPEYLTSWHCVIRSMVPIMEAALGRARAIADMDPLTSYLESHIDEERGHDEWVLEDLDVLGIDRSRVLSRVPSPTVASLAGSQYYWILHYHPVALLGYLALAEGYPPTPRLVQRLRDTTGYPAEAFRTLNEHSELDHHHGEEVDQLIDSLPLTRDLEEVMGLSAMSSVGLMARCIEEILETVPAEDTQR